MVCELACALLLATGAAGVPSHATTTQRLEAALGPMDLGVAQAATAGVGRAPLPEALRAIDIEVLPDGRGLPVGAGTAEEGKPIYAARCASCHGVTGREGPADVLAGGQGTLATARPVKTVGSYWPYATTLWDYINRAMPFAQPHSLSANEVYAVTAYVLSLNGIIGERDILSQTTLAQVKMPNRDGFIPDTRDHEHLPQR